MQSRAFLIHHLKWKQYWCFSLFYYTTDRKVKTPTAPPAALPSLPNHPHLPSLEAVNLILFPRSDPFLCLSPPALDPAVLRSVALVLGSRKAPGCCTRASPACCPPTCCHTLVTQEYFFIYHRCSTFLFSIPQPSAPTLNYFQLGQESSMFQA